MKTIGGILLAFAFCLASGVEANPVQGIYAIVLMGVAWACFKRADRKAAAWFKELKHKKMEEAA